MKDPKVLFPFLFASSWLGNLILTILAFFLAFTADGPLSPLIFLTVATCILAGNLLPIGAYMLFVKWRSEELKAEGAEANLRLRDALRRSEDVISRLDEAEGALSKAILIGRQLPEKINESFRSVEELAGKLNTLEVDSFAETIKENGHTLASFKDEIQALRDEVKMLKVDVAGFPKSIKKIVEEAIPEPVAVEETEGDVSVGERLDLVYESLESVQDTLDGLLGRIADLAVQPGANPAASEGVEDSEAEEEYLSEDLDESAEPDADDADSGFEAEEDPEGDDGIAFLEEESEAEEEADDEEDQKDNDIPSQDEMLLSVEPSRTTEEELPANVARLSARAMVGISNKLYIRGDEPWLSWDAGKPMNLVGIGEFAFQVENLKEPIEVALLLNDEVQAENGKIVLQPGKVTRVSPSFRK